MKKTELFEKNTGDYATMVGSDEYYGTRFRVSDSFVAVSTKAAVLSPTGGSVRLSLYKWKGDYESTVSEKPVSDERIDVTSAKELTLKGDFAAGEYLFRVGDGIEGGGVFAYHAPLENTAMYVNDVVALGSFDATLYFENSGEILPLSSDPVFVPGKRYIKPAEPEIKAKPDTWQLIDGLGRRSLCAGEINAKRKGKYVGMFYWTWQYHFAHNKPYNVTEIISAHPELVNDYHNPLWDNYIADAYFWNEPVYGYYTSTDRAVIRRQAELLANAGIDFIVFDCTNGSFMWREGYRAVFEEFDKAQKDGVNVPKIVFMLNFAPLPDTKIMLRMLYTDIYRSGKWNNLWFYYNGKPLIIGYNNPLFNDDPFDTELREFFTFKKNSASYFDPDSTHPDIWGWLSVYPQAKYGLDENGHPEQMCVSVAQNASGRNLVAMNYMGRGVKGRSYTYNIDYSYYANVNGEFKKIDKELPESECWGLNFQEQWDRVHNEDPDVVFITGWNEWLMGRHERWEGTPNAFPDEFDDEFSRDIEPTRGKLKDHYYNQLVTNVRIFKGSDNVVTDVSKTINTMSDWDEIEAHYFYRGSSPERESDGFSGTHYSYHAEVNEFEYAKCTSDGENIYFTVKVFDKLKEGYDKSIRLFIRINNSDAPNWEGMHFLVRHGALHRCHGGWCWQNICPAVVSSGKDYYSVTIPKCALGLFDRVEIGYKWCDNVGFDGDIMKFYTEGNVAPGGRFMISYNG